MSEKSNAFVYGNYLAGAGGSFPIDCETFDTIQNNQALLAILAKIAGDDKLIISGCALSGTTVGSGYVYMKTEMFPQGEILYVPGGFNADSTTKVHVESQATIIKVGSTTTYENAYNTRTLVVGGSTNGKDDCDWSEFTPIETNAVLDARCKELEKKVVDLKPLDYGIPLMWAGPITKIPDEYRLCNADAIFKIPSNKDDEYWDLFNAIGTIHTPPGEVATGFFRLPNLSGCFIVGYDIGHGDYNDIGLHKQGGQPSVKLYPQHMPEHNHSSTDDGSFLIIGGNSDHSSSFQYQTGFQTVNWGGWWHGSHKSTAQLRPSGSWYNEEHENRPPYYTLAYIMRVKAPEVKK